MNNIAETVLADNKIKIQEYTLYDQIGENFWHTTFLSEGVPLCGGYGKSKNYSRSVAAAEYLERTKYIELSNSTSDIKKKWGLDLIPTGCGFAAGFNQRNTIIRSLAEGLERWVISKWVDEECYLEEKDSNNLSKTFAKPSRWYMSQFDFVRFFYKEVVIQISKDFFKFKIAVVLCFKGDGVFMGSSADLEGKNIWLHALVESFRHLRIVKAENPRNVFPYNRIFYFSKNAEVIKKQVNKCIKQQWSDPKIILNHIEFFESEGYYLARSIFSNWRSWNLGGNERFLY